MRHIGVALSPFRPRSLLELPERLASVNHNRVVGSKYFYFDKNLMVSESNKRIAKNTGLLYFRLIFLTLINLYTVRITLEVLGVVDYGIYNVIGSVVASLSILTVAMSAATQRFLSFHLGKKDYEAYSKTFSLLIVAFIVLAIILIVIGEISGYFFLNDWLNIPDARLFAAKIIYQFSLLSFGFGLVAIPYNASIIANERMDGFAFFSIIDGFLKLAIVFVLIRFAGDRLILYGLLTAVEGIVMFLSYMTYCHVKFKYCKYIWEWNKSLFKELSAYTGWNLFGSVSAMLTTQGQNILLNIFFGPVINAAKAIGDRIFNVINGFSANLYMAVSPQIIKSYAEGNIDRTMNLVMRSSRISYFLIFIIAFPLVCEMDFILGIWIGNNSSSADMVAFSKLMLVYCMVVSMEQPITRLIQATGSIKRYQLTVGSVTLSFIPLAGLFFYLGASAPASMIILIVITSVAQGLRVYVANRQTGMDVRRYCSEVLVPLFVSSGIASILYFIRVKYIEIETWSGEVCVFIALMLSGLVIVWLCGLNRTDKEYLVNLVNRRGNKAK